MTSAKNIKFFLIFLALVLSASAVYAQCTYAGERLESSRSYCDQSLNPQAQKPDGAACLNPFECINKSCLEGTCTTGYEAEIAAKRGLLEQILAAIQGQALGAKTMNTSSSGVFSAKEIGISDSPITSVEIDVKRTTSAAVRGTDFGSSKPSAITSSPPGIAFRYLELSTYKNIANDIDSSKITFMIPKSWFDTNKADKEKVSMYRWDGTRWIMLSVLNKGEIGEHIRYTATSPGFSIFAITAAALFGTTTTTPTCSDGIQNQGETGIDCGGPCSACSPLCGNGIVESGENCKSCALDVKCAEGEICSYNKCLKKPFPFWTVFFIVAVVLIIGFIAFKKIKVVGEANKKELTRISSAIIYAVNASRNGEKEAAIKDNLAKAGWSARQISRAVKEAKKQLKAAEKKAKK